jgi:hypothetical protein
LQHAEVVTDASGTDTATLLACTRRISQVDGFTIRRVAIYETAAAREVEEAVYRELRKR